MSLIELYLMTISLQYAMELFQNFENILVGLDKHIYKVKKPAKKTLLGFPDIM